MTSIDSINADPIRAARDLIDAFSTRHGLPASLSEDGSCLFKVDERIDIHFHVVPESEEAFVYCAVGQLAQQPRADQLIALLEANHHWAGGAGAALALDLDTLALERLVPLRDLDPDALAQLIAMTVEAVEQLRLEHSAVLEFNPVARTASA